MDRRDRGWNEQGESYEDDQRKCDNYCVLQREVCTCVCPFVYGELLEVNTVVSVLRLRSGRRSGETLTTQTSLLLVSKIMEEVSLEMMKR